LKKDKIIFVQQICGMNLKFEKEGRPGKGKIVI